MPLDDQSELFIWVDKDDQELGTITRQEAHNGSRKIHRAVTIVVLNHNKTKILFQKRSQTKDLNPGVWACGVGGHVTKGDSYEKAATRELEEELGITGMKVHLLSKHLYEMPAECEYMPVYEISIPDEYRLTLDPTEVAEIQWCQIKKVPDFVATHTLAPDTKELLTQIGYLPN